VYKILNLSAEMSPAIPMATTDLTANEKIAIFNQSKVMPRALFLVDQPEILDGRRKLISPEPISSGMVTDSMRFNGG